MTPSQRGRFKVAVAIVLLILAGVGVWRFALQAPADAGVLVLTGNVDIRQVNLAFNVEGRITTMLVSEGDMVTAGQELARVESNYYTDGLAIARARLDAQKAQVAKLVAGSRPEEVALARANVAEAEASVTYARSVRQRQVELARRDVVSQQALEDAETALEQAQAKREVTRQQLALAVAGPRTEDIAAAKAQLAADQSTLSLIERRVADTVLYAPSAGTILTRVLEPGAIVLPGSAVYALSIDDPVWIRGFVPETALGRVKPGMMVSISTDMPGGRTYRGKVGFVSPTAEFTPRAVETPELRSSLVYRIRLTVEDADDGLRQGMPVTIKLDGPPPGLTPRAG
ncbi:efflux RND transporter periplasmic adaptor subunit [Skermanella stibiiresistens]|uniref:efflux RND transporter periplasmic adaptor subunit n=1 Tax=Skermanella stibiiresistens TaxID=913326 RepID=UPI0004B51662|nr:efflux RND transporter periplasmic adaptor subunit [Skermanella stibiiresistens]